jgi:glycosyltransferase involved in cell wall biosynthesis
MSSVIDLEARRPRVLHVVTISLSHRLMSGQLEFLRDHGFEVAACSSPGVELEKLRFTPGIQVFEVPMQRQIAPYSDLRSLWKLLQVIRRFKPDLINMGTPKAGLLAGIASWFARVPVRFYTLRGLRSETLRGWQRAVVAATERIAGWCAHQVICVSPSLRAKVIEFHLTTASKTSVLGFGSSNGVNELRFAPTKERRAFAEAERTRLGIPVDSTVIGYVGRFTRDKGFAELVQAFAEARQTHPDLWLLLLGDFEKGDPVPADVAKEVHGPNIAWLGFVPDAAPYYHLMDVLVLPTYREGFPNVVLEAQAAGKPVITTDATGAIDSIANGETGLVVPVGDASKLADAITRLADYPELRDSMGASGRLRIHNQFRNEIVWTALLETYAEALAAYGLAKELNHPVTTTLSRTE